MRVITGCARGRRLETLPGDDTRPTTDKVKEALFSAIQFDIEGRRVLDLFAGSGQLGIEALSRGAASCVFVDKNPEAVAIIKKNLQATKLFEKAQVVGTEVLRFLDHPQGAFDLVLMDPPYKAGLCEPAMQKAEPMLRDGGILVAETDDTVTLPDKVGRFTLNRNYAYGRIRLWLYRMEDCV